MVKKQKEKLEIEQRHGRAFSSSKHLVLLSVQTHASGRADVVVHTSSCFTCSCGELSSSSCFLSG